MIAWWFSLFDDEPVEAWRDVGTFTYIYIAVTSLMTLVIWYYGVMGCLPTAILSLMAAFTLTLFVQIVIG